MQMGYEIRDDEKLTPELMAELTEMETADEDVMFSDDNNSTTETDQDAEDQSTTISPQVTRVLGTETASEMRVSFYDVQTALAHTKPPRERDIMEYIKKDPTFVFKVSSVLRTKKWKRSGPGSNKRTIFPHYPIFLTWNFAKVCEHGPSRSGVKNIKWVVLVNICPIERRLKEIIEKENLRMQKSYEDWKNLKYVEAVGVWIYRFVSFILSL